MIAGKPHVSESYNEVTIDGIKVYVFKRIAASPAGIKISLESWWGFKTLQVEGVLLE